MWFSPILLFTSLVAAVQAATFTNPLKDPRGADPFIVWDNGYYYMTTTQNSNVSIFRSKTIAGLKTAPANVVYTSSDANRCCNLWAPELHKVDGVWYVYFTAGNSKNLDGQRPNVLQGTSADPNGPYTWKAKLGATNAADVWGIDGTVASISGKNYFVYSSISPAGLQSLFIAPMTNAWTLGARTLLSEPRLSWETVGFGVNEGPQPLYNGTRTWLTYSASYCDTDGYSLGLLTYKGGDPLNAGSWSKAQSPVFAQANGNYGPGHNGIFLSPDKKETWNVYHAYKTDPAHCDDGRTTMAQKVNWNSDGTPNFGQPRPRSEQITVPSGDGM